MGRERPGAGHRAEQGSNDVLMFAWMNREALAKTAELGRAVYFSRSRNKLWFKGEDRATCRRCTRSAWTATTTSSCSR
jgi:phosphoribosyl-AMP cyclohydrolase